MLKEATALQRVARKQTPEVREHFMGERGKGAPGGGNMVRNRAEGEKEDWKKGRSWMLH